MKFNLPVVIDEQIGEISLNRVFVLAESRAGSTWLIETLNSHPQIGMLDEIIKPEVFGSDLLSNSPGGGRQGNVKYIEKKLEEMDGGIKGCKILFPQAIRFLDFYEFLNNYKKSYFILLTRRNRIKAEVSDLIANRFSRWHLHKMVEVQPVFIEPSFLLERLQWRKLTAEFCIRLVRSHCDKILELNYEDLFSDLTIAITRIAEFLNVMGDQFIFSSEIKANPFSLDKMIINYDQCRDFLIKDTDYASMLEEQGQ